MTSALLLSGGLDSAALAYSREPNLALTIDYGQVCAKGEIRAASAIARSIGLNHEVLTVDCSALGSGDLAGSTPSNMAPVPEWWPYRNQLLVTLAAMRATADGVDEILLGIVRSDSAHLDGTRDFVQNISQLCSAQEGQITVSAPAIGMTTEELIRSSGAPRTLLAWCHSCHTAAYACGQCRGCLKHRRVTQQVWDDES